MRERLEESERFGSADAIRLIGRALRYIGPFRFEFSVKLAMLIGSFIPMLFLPWPTRILIDQVIMGIPFGEELTPFPFFIQPFVDLGQGLSTTELLAWKIGAQFALLVLIGAFGVDFRERDRADAR
ncbi:MAG: hypothetical protein JRE70_01810, partial [Deltaproteobacteria bacterium]|nr:hypothetical protein [Deltaproteobacteria bacterium]